MTLPKTKPVAPASKPEAAPSVVVPPPPPVVEPVVLRRRTDSPGAHREALERIANSNRCCCMGMHDELDAGCSVSIARAALS